MSFLAETFQRLPYFRGISETTLAHFTANTSARSFHAGEIILLEGERAPGLWMIEQGRVKIYKMNEEGVEHVMRILGDGDTFNDIPALDGGINPANAAALSEARLYILPHEALMQSVETDPKLAINIVRSLCGRVRGLVHQIEDLALYSVVVRLARFLLAQAEERNLSGPGVTRAAIAAHLATTPQTVSTILRQFEEAGAIEFDRHTIAIVREDLLRGIAML